MEFRFIARHGLATLSTVCAEERFLGILRVYLIIIGPWQMNGL